MKLTRRKLFALFAGASVAKAAPAVTLTFPNHPIVPRLRLHRDAFTLETPSLTMEEFRERYLEPWAEAQVRSCEEWIAKEWKEWERDRQFVDGQQWP